MYSLVSEDSLSTLVSLLYQQVSAAAAADRPARRSASRPPCCTQISTVSVINWWPMTVTSLPHWPSTYVDSTWDNQPFQRYGWCPMRFPSSFRWTLCVSLSPSKGGWKREFLHFALPFISSLQVIVDTSNLLRRLTVASFSLRATNCPWNGRGHVTRSTLNFKALKHTLEITEARIVKFLTQVGYI